MRRCLLKRLAGGEMLTGLLAATQTERRRRGQPIRQDRKRRSTGMADAASHPYSFVPVIVRQAEPLSMADDRLAPANRAPPRQQVHWNYPGSALSFVSGNEIKRITAGVRARRDRACQVSICWPGLHPPAKSASNEKRILLCVDGREPTTRDIGRFKSTSRPLCVSRGTAHRNHCRYRDVLRHVAGDGIVAHHAGYALFRRQGREAVAQRNIARPSPTYATSTVVPEVQRSTSSARCHLWRSKPGPRSTFQIWNF